MRFWIQKAVGLWVCCAVLAIFIGCSSPERQANVVIWVWSSLTPTKSVNWKGERYAARELSAWLSDTIYNGTPGEWLTWALLVGFAPVCVVGIAGWWYVKRPEPDDRHIRGAEVLSVETL